VSKVSTLLIRETNELDRVKQFLNSKGRKSEKTKTIYSIALSHFHTFLQRSEFRYNAETILIPLVKGKIDVYSLFDTFIGYLVDIKPKLAYQSITVYIAGVKSYLEYHDVDISSTKFRKKVTLPSKERRIKEAIDAEDIRTILLGCTNVRLKALLLVLASSGMRVGEALALRNSDIHLDESPTRIHIAAQNTKTSQERYAYISDEASIELNKFIDSRYSNSEDYKKYPNHLIFTKRGLKRESVDVRMLYVRLHDQFIKLLDKVGMNQRNGIRRNITLHSFRSFVKSVVSVNSTADYSEWLLGHSFSTYWSIKESEKKELYKKCEPYLTFLDYVTVSTVSKNLEDRLEQKEKEIQYLRKKDTDNSAEIQRLKEKQDSEMKAMDEKIDRLMTMYTQNPKLANIKPEVLKKKVQI
jgi:integrase